MSRHYTFEEIKSLEPCYTDEELLSHLPNGVSITAEQIALANVGFREKLWVLTKLMVHDDLITFACDCAERTLPIYEQRWANDDRLRKAITTIRSGDKLKIESLLPEVDSIIRANIIHYATPAKVIRSLILGIANSTFTLTTAKVVAFDSVIAIANVAIVNYTEYASSLNQLIVKEREWQISRLVELINQREKCT